MEQSEPLASSVQPPEVLGWVRRWERVYASSPLGALSLALAACYVLVLSGVALLRVRYPFELEWIEGGLLDEMRRVRAGQGLYVAPSLSYVPFVYNPLYFWLSAAASLLVGHGFFAMRLVSLLATWGALALIVLLVERETKSWLIGVLGAGAYAATFKVCEQFMDLARVDASFVAFFLAAAWTASRARSRGGRAGAALLLVASFLVKQSGALAALPLMMFLAWDGAQGSDRRWQARALAALPAALVPLGIAVSVLWLDYASDGWYRYYAFELPRLHRLVPELWLGFWQRDMLGTFGIVWVGALFVLLGPSELSLRSRLFWTATLSGVVLTSWFSRLHDGGWTNVLMPAFAVLACLFAIGIGRAVARFEHDARGRAFVATLACVQLCLLAYDPTACVPSDEDRAAGWSIVRALQAADGDVFVPTNSYLSTLAGKPPHLHEMAARDVFRAGHSEQAYELDKQITRSLYERRWAALITDNDFYAAHVLANYKRVRLSVPGEPTFYPVTGAQYRPGWLFAPN